MPYTEMIALYWAMPACFIYLIILKFAVDIHGRELSDRELVLTCLMSIFYPLTLLVAIGYGLYRLFLHLRY